MKITKEQKRPDEGDYFYNWYEELPMKIYL